MSIGVLVAVSPKPTFALWVIGLTHHSTGPARKAAQAGEFRRWVKGKYETRNAEAT